MGVVPYERQVEPRMVKSPFLRGVTGPGFFGEPKGEEDEDGNAPVNPGNPPVHTPAPTPLPATPVRPPSAAPYRPLTGWASSRSVVAVLGGPQVMEQVTIRDVLPNETCKLIPRFVNIALILARLFERDPREQVLWFSGPPILTGVETRPTHSIEYLEAIAKKRRLQKEQSEAA